MPGRKLRDAEDARSCLNEIAASGLTRGEWSRANGVDGRSLNAWDLNLSRRREQGEARLVELVPSERVVEAPVRYVVRCGELAVEVDHRFDDEVLRRLLSVVASC